MQSEMARQQVREPPHVTIIPACNHHDHLYNDGHLAPYPHWQEVATKAKSTWDRFRKERDFHKMHHKRVVQVRTDY